MEIYADTISKAFEIFTSSPFLIITITFISIYIFKSMANAVIGNYPSSEPEAEVEEFSEPEPEVKEVPKPQIKKIVVKPVIKKPQLVVCDYCGTKHKAEDKICKTGT